MSRLLTQATTVAAVAAIGCAVASSALFASSHREAPFITEMPKVDGTDFYMFSSYEGVAADGTGGQSDFVTLIANYQPLEDAYGGPNYFTMDPDARYEIHIDNNGDAVEDLTFRFTFNNTYRSASLPIGPDGGAVTIPLTNVGPGPNVDPVGPGINDNGGLNVVEDYQLTVIRGDRKTGTATTVTNLGNAGGDSPTNSPAGFPFRKPVDNIGGKTFGNPAGGGAYATYANNHIFDIDLSTAIPGCDTAGHVFVGQRHEGFVVNLGEVFDRVNLNPLGDRNAKPNTIGDKNVTSLALEVPASCLTAGGDTVIGGWTTASLPQAKVYRPNPTVDQPEVNGGAFTQVSRLGSPLVNEVVIGLDKKDLFNASEPYLSSTNNDVTNFGAFVLYPTLPQLINALFPVTNVPATPRGDLLAAFVTGIRTPVNGEAFNFTQPQAIADGTGTAGEMLRLNTAIAPAQAGSQSDLGFLGCDLAGFPNGRRPVDDVVDIELSVAEGAVAGLAVQDDPETEINEANPNNLQTCDVSGPSPAIVNAGAVINDGAQPDPADYLTVFPYLDTPLPGSPASASIQ